MPDLLAPFAISSRPRLLRLLGALVLAALLAVPSLMAQAPDSAAPDDSASDDQTLDDPALAAVREYREAHEAEILHRYVELLRLPNHARDGENIRANARVLRDELAKRGVEAQLLELDDPSVPPLVWGRLDVGAERTVGLYVHYDGQPVQRELWTFDPFEPVLTTAALEDGGTARPLPAPGEAIDPEWRLYARSSSDDKAPIPALLTALDGLAAAGIEPTVNMVFLFEGEEEIGSPHLGAYMERYRERLTVDGWLICDGPVHQSGKPQLVFGVRGYSGAELTVYGPVRGLHSGHYGNWAPNPAMMLARLLASMKDAEGRVTIDGFHAGEAPITEADRRAIASVPAVEEQLMAEMGLGRTEVPEESLLERLLTSSLNVRGLEAAGVGEEARNVIPATATAALDMRLARGLTPDDVLDRLEAHIRGQGYHIVREDPDLETRRAHPRIVKVVRGTSGYRAVRTPVDHPFARAVERAARRAAGEDLILMPTLGGSLPLYLFEEVLDAPLVVVPIANHDNNQHAPDENLRLGNLRYGAELMAALLTMAPPTGDGH